MQLLEEIFEGIVGIQKNSFIDFPGTASAVLFYGGCNLRCPYCHNRDLACGLAKPSISAQEIVAFLKKRKGMLDGVVITGGEPTLHKNLPNLIQYLKELGYKVKLDSNGLAPEVLEKLSVDYLAIDIKSSFAGYQNYLGIKKDVSNALQKSIQIIKERKEAGEVRITSAPTIITKEIIEEIAPELEGVSKVFIQAFKPNSTLMNPHFFDRQENFAPKELQEFATILKEHVKECSIRGI